MNSFDEWFSNIVGTCALIADPEVFRRKWVDHEQAITSIYDYDELFEQLFGDLRLDEQMGRFQSELSADDAYDALRRFAKGLRQFDFEFENTPALQNAADLLKSPQWKTFQALAQEIIALPTAKRFL